MKLTDPPTSIRNAIQIAELEERMALEKAILQELTKVKCFEFGSYLIFPSGFTWRIRYVICKRFQRIFFIKNFRNKMLLI